MASVAPLVLTMGEPAGVGPELIAMAWRARSGDGNGAFYCIGDSAFLARRFADAGIATPVAVVADAREAASVFAEAVPVMQLATGVSEGVAGRPSVRDAPAVIESLARAVDDVRAGQARAIVTPPIQKRTLYDAGFRYPGHTEFLGERAAALWPGVTSRAIMMLACDELRVVPVTVHIPLAAVHDALSIDLIVETGLVTAADLATRFGIREPRIAVAGLNPHAGENGSIGTEETDTIKPALELLKDQGLDVVGPYPADTMFHAHARTRYDAALAMYHDQALIPIKTIAFDRAVNVTLGLPFVRTSPDHGTALDIAGTGQANPASFLAAIDMADRMSRPR